MTTGEIEVLKTDRDAWKATAEGLQENVKKLQQELETMQLKVDTAERAYQDMAVEYMRAQDKIDSMKSTCKVHVMRRNDPSTIYEYDNVVSLTDPMVKDIGYCKRLVLDNGMAIDFWASDWKVLKLDWFEV